MANEISLREAVFARIKEGISIDDREQARKYLNNLVGYLYGQSPMKEVLEPWDWYIDWSEEVWQVAGVEKQTMGNLVKLQAATEMVRSCPEADFFGQPGDQEETLLHLEQAFMSSLKYHPEFIYNQNRAGEAEKGAREFVSQNQEYLGMKGSRDLRNWFEKLGSSKA